MYGALTLLIHGGLSLLAGKIFKIPLFLLSTSSQANIGGAVSAPIVAEAYRPGTAHIGVLMAVTGAVLGTPAYMSPEQVNGKKVDGRADIFSLGVTLFELLTGEKPFHADSIAALLYQIANIDHPDVREFNKKVPLSVVRIINKALAKDAAQRYQTAGQMEEDLRNCLKSWGSTETPAPVSATLTSVPAPEETLKKAPVNEDAAIDNKFISELESAFDIKTEATATKTLGVAPEPTSIVHLDKDKNVQDIPLLPDIEATLQLNPKPPEAPKS
jgi:serine/threonine protein kinase